MFGWFLFALASFCMYFSSIGVFYIFDDFRYFVEIALTLEALVFSVALADKINQLEQKKNEANMELILNQQFEKQRLEYQVKEKTKALKKAYDEKNLLLKELNHRVKNNMQTIISLIRLQSEDIEDNKIKNMFHTIQNRINAMSSLHELLYNQDDPSHINAYDYLEKLVDELKESFETQNIKINFDINVNIKSEQAVYCGLIVNELITNAFKYAFIDGIGTINISLKKENSSYILSIYDNGIGYEKQNNHNTLGLILVDTLATKQLKGKIQHNTENGVKVVISWS
jgi:two-component sensor histidine kinase